LQNKRMPYTVRSMEKLIFCTGNVEKVSNAQIVCASYGITVEQRALAIDEIQGEDTTAIVADKLDKAFLQCGEPLVVSDDAWAIPALRGFPGPYMKSINHWFTPDDFLRLTLPLENRAIYLIQQLGFTDGVRTKIISRKVTGELLKAPKGQYGAANHKLVSLAGDNGLSIAEIYDQGLDASSRQGVTIWHDFMAWYRQEYSRADA
jgi:XTP/dITP diphosphohydrolase